MTELYKRDSKGKIRIWKIQVQRAGTGTIQEASGLKDGKLVINTRQCTPKNVGRSNETTAYEQAVSEMESKIAEKLRTDYFRTEAEAVSNVVILPMLAKDYKKESKKVKFPCYAQPKLDGMRCLVKKVDGVVSLWSRKGVEITTLDHIKKDFEDSRIPDNIYDGEVYNLELGSFQQQMKAIKKYRPGVTETIKFNCYDLVSSDTFEKRMTTLHNILGKL